MRIGRQRKWSRVCAAEMPPAWPTGQMSVLPGYDMQRSLLTLTVIRVYQSSDWYIMPGATHSLDQRLIRIYLKSAHTALVIRSGTLFCIKPDLPMYKHSWVITYRTMHKSMALYVTIWHKLGCSRVSQCIQSHVSYVFGTLWQAR